MRKLPVETKYNVGFEIEFSHEWPKSVIQKDISRILNVSKLWVPKYTRRSNKQSQAYYKNFYTLYHDNTIDPDFGDQEPFELVTSVYPNINIGKNALKKIFEWMDDTGATTNYTTGLHVNLASNYITADRFCKSKIITNLNDRTWLEKYNREKGLYCAPYKNWMIQEIDDYSPAKLSQMRDFSVSFRRPHYFEFRIIGGKNYHKKWDKVEKTIDHYLHTLEHSYL